MKNSLRSVVLAMVGLLAISVPATAQNAHKYDNDPDMVEVRNYKLSMDKIHRLAGVWEKLEAIIKANPGLKKAMNSGDDDNRQLNITQLAHEIDVKFPMAMPVIATGGFSTREFLVASMAVFSDAMIVSMKEGGTFKEYPPNMILPENAALLEQHKAELDGLMKKMMPEQKDDDSSN